MKRKITLTLKAFALGCLLLLPGMINQAKACVMPDPQVTVHCDYDSNMTDVAIWVSNLGLFSAGAGQFCSCAITNYTNIFTNVSYVAFVDSGTTNPVAGFTPFNGHAAGSAAWENVLATGNWDAFLSQTVGAGLPGGAPAQMLIRASLPAGYTFALLDSNLVVTQAGFDEWDNTNSALSGSHQEIRGFWNVGGYTEISPSSTFFSDLDNDILTGLSDLYESGPAISVFPNPSNGLVKVQAQHNGLEIRSYQLMDVTGKLVAEKDLPGVTTEVGLDVSAFKQGIYFLKVNTSEGVLTEKVLVLD